MTWPFSPNYIPSSLCPPFFLTACPSILPPSFRPPIGKLPLSSTALPHSSLSTACPPSIQTHSITSPHSFLTSFSYPFPSLPLLLHAFQPWTITPSIPPTHFPLPWNFLASFHSPYGYCHHIVWLNHFSLSYLVFMQQNWAPFYDMSLNGRYEYKYLTYVTYQRNVLYDSRMKAYSDECIHLPPST